MRTYPGVRPSQFRDPGERNQIKVIDDMLRQVTGALAGLEQTGQQPLSGVVGGGGGVTLPIAETDITDGALLARVADNESITGSWDFNSDNDGFLRVLSQDSGGGYDGVGLLVTDSVNMVKLAVNALQSADGQLRFPDCSAADLILLGSTETVTVQNKIMATGTKLRVNATGTNCVFQDASSSTKQMGLDISAITAGSTRAYSGLNLTGAIPLVGNDPPAVAAGALGKVDLTAQAAAIGATNLSSTPPAGLYRVDVYAVCTTAQAAITLDVNIAWTDTLGATNRNVTAEPGSTAFPLLMTGTGRASASLLCQVASGDIAYSTVCAGLTTGRYALYIRVMSLG